MLPTAGPALPPFSPRQPWHLPADKGPRLPAFSFSLPGGQPLPSVVLPSRSLAAHSPQPQGSTRRAPILTFWNTRSTAPAFQGLKQHRSRGKLPRTCQFSLLGPKECFPGPTLGSACWPQGAASPPPWHSQRVPGARHAAHARINTPARWLPDEETEARRGGGPCGIFPAREGGACLSPVLSPPQGPSPTP